jgi:hypothetical protein
MPPTSRVRAVGVAFLLVATLVAAACEDDSLEDDQRIDSARDFNRARQAPQTVTPGPAQTPAAGGLTATPPPESYRYATTTPITAVFDQGTFTTTYAFNATGQFPQGGFIEWSGPNCGTVAGGAFSIAGVQRSQDLAVKAPYTWVHPHPPCGNAPDHSDATIVATLKEGDGRPGRTPLFITTCIYKGSATGTGPACETRQETSQ